MRNRTKKLVKQIRELEYVEDRLALLHETYSDCKSSHTGTRSKFK